MKIVLLGTPHIAVKAFTEVIKNFEVVAVVTQPDRPVGRGLVIQESPVARLAKEYNIKVYKPEKISQIKAELAALNFDLMLTFAFGQYIPTDILALGKYKPLNIHGSLLPKYRGAAPIHYAILNGDKEIGITLMEMVKEMDAGPMLFQARQEIGPKTTTGQAFDIIADLAASNIVAWLKMVEASKATFTPQPDNYTLSPKIEKAFGELTGALTKNEIARRVYALNPAPGVFFFRDGQRIKVFDIADGPSDKALAFQARDGVVYFDEYQFEGKKRVSLKGKN